MDFTTVFRPLIYKDRDDIDDFPVDETDNTDYLTMESVFMEKLEYTAEPTPLCKTKQRT